MDERERLWLSSEDPQVLLRHLQGFHDPVSATYTDRLKVASDRKLRLFADACCADPHGDPAREFEHHASVTAIQAARAMATEMHAGKGPIRAALLREIFGNPFRPVTLPMERRCRKCRWDGRGPNRKYCECGSDPDGKHAHAWETMCTWLTWNDGAVLKLAQAIYEERAWDRMPILADALEEAGCGEEVVLRHCRGWMPCPKCGGTSVESYRPFGERGESDVRLCQHCNPDTYERMVGRRHPDSGWVRPKCRECNGSGRVPDFMGYKVGLPGSCCDCAGTGHAPLLHCRGCHVLDLLLGKS